MATPSVDISQQSQLIPPQAQPSQEHTADAPMVGTSQEPPNNGNISEEDQQRLIALARRYKDQWSQDRMVLIEECLENLEFFKGNQNIVFGPGTTAFTNTQSWMDTVSPHAQNADDDDLFQDCLNFYQMLAIGFVAALCPRVPKSKWMPDDADQPGDVATAKAAQVIIDKVERDNKEGALLKSQLLLTYTCGSVFRFTRFVVSAALAGTKQEPVYDQTETEIMPARMHCFNCGADNPGLGMGTMQRCSSCQEPLGEDSFFPPVSGNVTRQIGTQEVANGIVAQNLYSPLEVDVDPKAEKIRDTPILNLEYEVHIGALRTAYPKMFAQIQASATSELSSNGSIDRIARQQVYSQTHGQSSILSDQRPTLSQTWFQPWAFSLEDDEPFVERMTKAFPTGCLLINTGPTFLTCKEMDMNKHWTVAKAHEGFGMNPPPPGKVVVPFQRRYNDMGNILHDGIARCFAGVVLANNDLIDSKSFEGKKLLFGALTGVKLKRTGAPGSMRLEDALYQFKYDLKIREAMEYQKHQALSAQTFALVPPQVYGGQGDPNIQTAAGQEQNLNTALGALSIYWGNVKDEHAEADQQAVVCAKDNLTEDLRYSIEDKGAEYRTAHVKLDDLQGGVRAYSDEDQGLPVTPAELRQRWESLWQAAEKNPVTQAIFDDPENQEQAADAMGVPGMVVPGADMRSKVLQIIEQLVDAEPIPQINPQTRQPAVGQDGKPVFMPSIMPNQDIDDFTILKEVVRRYCQKNFDIEQKKPAGFANLLAYYKRAVMMETAQQVQQAQQQGTALGAGKMAAAPPPPPPKQLSMADRAMQMRLRQAAGVAVDNQLKIGSGPPLGQGQSYQAAEAANADILQLSAKIEQIAADSTQ